MRFLRSLGVAHVAAVLLLFRTVVAECPHKQPMDFLIAVPRGSIAMPDLWNMGADDFGISGDRLIVRVSRPMLEVLEARGVPHEMLCHDIEHRYREYRRGTAIKRAESFADYHDLVAVEAAMRRIAGEHSDIAALVEIGRSIENRPIYALRISDNAQQIEPQEPGMVVMGCHHAREWISVEVPLYFADYLTTNYHKEGAVTRLMNHTELWVIPVLNPDGFAYTRIGFPNSFRNRWWRKNRRDNGDGTFGVDPNRNYLVGFGDDGGSSSVTFSEVYRGPTPFSEPETRAIRDLMSGVTFPRTFVTGLSYHNFSQLVMYPNGYSNAPVENVHLYQELAAEMTRLINSSHNDPRHDYIYGQPSDILYIANGTFEDWAHHAVGAISFIIELRPSGWPFFELPSNEILPTCRENLPAFLYLAERTMIPDLKAIDADDDGYLDSEDYCPGTPARAAVDDLGCAAAEVDLDGDGVLNRGDACRDTPEGQQVTPDGCRVPAVFSVRVSSSVAGANIELVPRDIDNRLGEITGERSFIREYGEATQVALTAAEAFDGNRFAHWTIDEVPQPGGQLSVRIEEAESASVEAVYVVPVHIEIAGPARIPDRRADGLGFSVRYAVQTVYNDGSVLPAEAVADWSLSNPEVAALTADGELLAYDVLEEPGEVTTVLSARVDYGERSFVTEPFPIRIFDTQTRKANCREVAIEGPDRVESLSTTRFAAMVALDGESSLRDRSSESYWAVSGTAESPTDFAAVAQDGTIRTDWVAQDRALILENAYVNDDGTVCLAQKNVVIAAGNPADDPSRRPTLVGSGTCGAMGMLCLSAMLLGLFVFRLIRP